MKPQTMTSRNGVSISLSPSNTLAIESKTLRLQYHLADGTFDYGSNGVLLIGSLCSGGRIDGRWIDSTQYARHEVAGHGVSDLNDATGEGIEVVIESVQEGLPVLRQVFRVYADSQHFLVSASLQSDEEIGSNHIAPIVMKEPQSNADGLALGGIQNPSVLRVPFDNDKWVRYCSVDNLRDDVESYEVTAIYDPQTHAGVVIGSIDHDTWKTGIRFGTSQAGVLSMTVYGGAASELTRDTLPHGMVTGNVLSSPRIFVGWYPDVRSGLEVFGQVNANATPPLRWEHGAPFGWNSWAAVENEVNYDLYVQTSEFLATQVQNHGYHNGGRVYVNFDSFWDNLTEEQLVEAARRVRANGQRPGIYWAPFAYWGSDHARPVEGTDGTYTFSDLLLRDKDGNVLPELDGGLAIDPTHPGTLARIRYQVQRFIDWGYEYIKLDFLGHAALEGHHFDPSVQTGIQAYNVGMKYLVERLQMSPADRPFFISLSIAPLFPHQYGHARRISCDAWGSIRDSEYMLNALSYGWWASGTLYPFNDPDHIVLHKSHKREPVTEHEARTRLHSAIIAGTVLMDSDDFRLPEARERASLLLTNEEVNEIARAGKTFRPTALRLGDGAADLFVRHDEANRVCYVALFNYSDSQSAERSVDLRDLGLAAHTVDSIRDLWTQERIPVQGETFRLTLEPTESKLLELSLRS